MVLGKSLAFYAIFFRHEHGILVCEPQLFGAIGVMILKGMFPNAQTACREGIKESLRVTYARHGMHVATSKIAEVTASEFSLQGMGTTDFQDERDRILASLPNHQIDLPQTRRRFAKRPYRQTMAIPQSSGSIDHDDLQLTTQGIVLQAVIRQNHIAIVRLQKMAGRCNPIRPDHHGQTRPACQQHRFVTGLGRIALPRDFQGIGG